MDDIFTHGPRPSDLAKYGLAPAEADAVLSVARPAARFTVSSLGDPVPVGASKLSGCPDLPNGTDWPVRPAYGDIGDKHRNEQVSCERRSNSAHLPFIAQINLADAWAVQPDLPAELPKTGVLSLFFDLEEDLYGAYPEEKVGWKLIYSEDTDLERRPLPEALENTIAAARAQAQKARHTYLINEARKQQGWFDRTFRKAPDVDISRLPPLEPFLPPERGMTPFASLTLPEFEVAYQAVLKVSPFYVRSDDETPLNRLFHDEYEFGLRNRFSQLCGHEHIIQGPEMPIMAQLLSNGAIWGLPEHKELRKQLMPGVKDWVLIAQITGDGAVWSFGDAGFIYVWMRVQDIEARAFDKAWVFVESH